MVVGGIVTFNPDIKRLHRNIEIVIKQVDYLIIIDNNSKNRSQITAYIKRHLRNKIFYIKNHENIGLASALNQLFDMSKKLDAEWTLTLDQDSILPAQYISVAEKYFQKENIGIICPVAYDTNINKKISKKNRNNMQKVEKCITSASLIRNKVWEQAGKFDEQFFIDYVDFDFCIRVRKLGFQIIQLNTIYFEHELGNSKLIKLGKILIRVSNHNYIRRYYMIRNIIIYIRKHKKNVLIEIFRIIKVYFIVILFEEDKKRKILSMNKGMVDGICLKLKKEK